MKYTVESAPLFTIEDQSQQTYTIYIELLHKVTFIEQPKQIDFSTTVHFPH